MACIVGGTLGGDEVKEDGGGFQGVRGEVTLLLLDLGGGLVGLIIALRKAVTFCP